LRLTCRLRRPCFLCFLRDLFWMRRFHRRSSRC
jgi:hypothetical protein